MRKPSEWREWYEEHISEVTDEFWSHQNRLAMSGIFPRHWHLLYMPSAKGEWGSLCIVSADDHPIATDVFVPECPVPPMFLDSRDSFRAWLWKQGRRLPILAVEGAKE